MSTISFQKTSNLGTFDYRPNFCSNGEKEITIHEDIRLTLYQIDPNSGLVRTDSSLTPNVEAAKVYEYVLKTRAELEVLSHSVLFWPERTHSFKDCVLDLFCPYTRRYVHLSNENAFPKKTITILTFIGFDALTFIIRIFTFIPAVISNATKSHPLKKTISQDLDNVYVKCEKTWSFENSDQTFTTTFEWRVDFYSPLSISSYFSIDGSKLMLNHGEGIRAVHEGNYNDKYNFCRSTLQIDGASALKLYKKDDDKGYTLVDVLIFYHMQCPNVTYL